MPRKSARWRPAEEMVTAYTLTNTGKEVGIGRAAKPAGMSSAISFTLEADGWANAAIGAVDEAPGGLLRRRPSAHCYHL